MEIEAPEEFVKFTEEFDKQIITVLPGVHCAIGYGLANSILIEGDEGNIIIDTLESREAAIELRPDFQAISSKPVVAIIYTHNHADHVCGADVLAGDNVASVKVYAHATTRQILNTTLGTIHPIIFRRAARQFGIYLTPETGSINDGIGKRLHVNNTTTSGLIYPTNTFDGSSFNLNIAGREFILYHAPGETDDQIVVYMPKEKVLFAADNIYKAFPNLYAIRGTTTRDAVKWVSSLDLMRNLHAEFMIPSHTKPVCGAENIYEVITIYRDGIQFVHDQTVRFMNKGYTPDEIIGNKLIQLPDQLKKHPYLQEFYGTVDWSIRGIFNQYLGWYSGKSSDLNPDPPAVRAENIIQLGGGYESVLEKAKTAYQEGKYQWCLELTEYLELVCMQKTTKVDIGVLQASALKKLATTQFSANGRNWYLSKSLEIQGTIKIEPPATRRKETILKASIKDIFSLLSVRMDYKKAAELTKIVQFEFEDIAETFQIHIRNGILEVRTNSFENVSTESNYFAVHILKAETWKQLIAGMGNLVTILSNNEITVKKADGSTNQDINREFVQFLSLFTSD